KFYALGDLLNQRIDAPAVTAAGYRTPYANFTTDWGATATLARALRPFPHINGPVNNEYNPIGSSWYDSLQLKLDRRFGPMFLEANYTRSKSLSNASGSQTSGDSANRNPKTDNPFNPRALELSKTFSYIDIPNIANLVMVFDIPFGKGKKFFGNNGVVDRFLGGWSVSFTGSYANGALVLLNAPYTYPQWGFAYGRKNVHLTGNPVRTGVARKDLDPRAGQPAGTTTFNRAIANAWLNLDYFRIPGTYELGTAPAYLNEARDPNIYSDNMGLIKRTRITETINFEIRGELFNVFNRTNFGMTGTPVRPNVIDTNAVTGRFGVVAGPRSGARLGQIVAKINF
ncbi:MAG: hypothetical protein ACKV2V_23330, partial [Blastocatellia bacterium]